MTNTLIHKSRTEAAATELKTLGFDALLVCTQVSMGYLHGYFEESHERLLVLAINQENEVRMICPSLSEQQARRCGIADIRTWRDGDDPMAHIRQLAEDWKLRSGVIAVDDHMPAMHLLDLQAVLPAALFRPAGEVMARLMRVKSEDELTQLLRAGQIADKAYEEVVSQLKPGLTENQIAEMLRSSMKKNGGNPTFCIVAIGAASAEPHHLNDDTAVHEGDIVLMDFGCEFNHYNSDITRTVCVGTATDEMKKVYEVVYAAHMAGRQAIRGGVASQNLDRVAREVIEKAGYGEYFIHRLGHGLGMQVHEEPYIVEGNKLPLAAGHCFSIEPGIYVPGNFGIRIENIVSATDTGHISFNADPSPTLVEVY